MFRNYRKNIYNNRVRSIKNKSYNVLLNMRYLAYLLSSIIRNKQNSDSINGIVFSKNRPMQLHALLNSYYKYIENHCPLVVLYKSTNADYDDAYKKVQLFHAKRNITFKKECNFRDDLTDCLLINIFGKVFFLVDDIIFVRKFDLRKLSTISCNFFIPSMRLGKNIVYSYMTDKKFHLPPMIESKKKNVLYWPQWLGKEYWNYPFSVDGNIYAVKELLFLIGHIKFSNPNSFESNMNKYRFIMRLKFGVCFYRSVLFNDPINTVRSKMLNKSGSISSDSLLNKFNEGYEIDIRPYDNIKNNSSHYEIGLTFKKRKG